MYYITIKHTKTNMENDNILQNFKSTNNYSIKMCAVIKFRSETVKME